MKSLISIIVVILVFVLAMGAISSLTEGVGSGVGGSSSTTTAPSSGGDSSDGSISIDDNLILYNYFYSVGDSSAQTQVADYLQGKCLDFITGEESNRIYMGSATYRDSEALIAFAFDSLQIGKTYVIQFYHTTDVVDSVFRYRYGNSGAFKTIDVLNSRDGYHTLVFKATGVSFQLGIVHFPEMPSSSTLQIYGDELRNDVMFSLYEVME